MNTNTGSLAVNAGTLTNVQSSEKARTFRSSSFPSLRDRTIFLEPPFKLVVRKQIRPLVWLNRRLRKLVESVYEWIFCEFKVFLFN